jgi:L-asparaginase/Glu-tRNA(Gln) amidotransferase subunit D
VLIKQHGDKAPIHAAMKTEELLAAGAMEGKAVWLRIAKAAEELLSDKQADGAVIH